MSGGLFHSPFSDDATQNIWCFWFSIVLGTVILLAFVAAVFLFVGLWRLGSGAEQRVLNYARACHSGSTNCAKLAK